MTRYFLFAFFLCAAIFLQNQCLAIDSYYYKDWYDAPSPDTYLTTPKIIRRHGYPAEAHIIQSEDGYLLEYHRIPHGKNRTTTSRKYPVLLHHGLLCSSVDWVTNGPEKALAYRLADEGYDVWLANVRGNTYSRSHIALSPSDRSFWDFSFHEMGIYDLPAAIDYILNVTSAPRLIYIGHSLGTTTFYAFATSRPEYGSKVLVHISVAPVAAIPHATSIFRLLVPVAKEIRSMTDWYYKGAFLEHDKLSSLFCKYVCGKNFFNTNFCMQLIMFNLFGKDKEQFDGTLIPLITSNIPAGTSGKNMIHCSQLISSGGKFRYYDYGVSENIRRYKSANPPTYNISNIKIPMKFYYGKNDILADPTDVEILYQQVSKPMGLTLIGDDKWNHIDFLWAIDVNKYFNNELLEFLNNVTTKSDFIMASIEHALAERPHQYPDEMLQNAPPFNAADFENRVAQLPGLSKAVDEVSYALKTNPESGTDAVKKVIDLVENELQKKGRSLNDGKPMYVTENAMNTVGIIASTASETINVNVSSPIDQKMKETLEKLAAVFSNSSSV